MENNNKFYNPILEKYNIYFSEEQFIDNVKAALKKMETFLIEHEIAIPLKEVKQKSKIEIKGIADNGKERLLQSEIIKKYGEDLLEDSEGYNTLLPIFKEGVIRSGTKELGTYYTHFTVTEETKEYFDLEIYDYRFYNQTFYLQYIIHIEGLNKKIPLAETQTYYAGINSFFFEQFSRQDLKEFSDDELNVIKEITASDSQEEDMVDSITSMTLSTFRVINFLNDYYLQNAENESLILNNDYFQIKNWDKQSVVSAISEDKELQTESFVNKILSKDVGFHILDTHTIGSVILKIIENANIDTFYLAIGFAFQSGLKILEPAFQVIRKRGGNPELIIGALQNYDDKNANNKIDRKTVTYLNRLVDNGYIKLYTHTPFFYHGKFYYMSNENKSYVIIGSSNISKTSFNVNYEMDVVHIMDKGSEQEKLFLNWYTNLKTKCRKIESLDEYNFCEYNWKSELDAFHSLKNQRVSNEEVRRKIDALSDEELKYRFTLWMRKNPTERYENIEIEALKDYIMFVYAENGLVVFESFVPGNAYYVFRYRNSLTELLATITRMSKTQMACSAHYIRKGYHMQSRERLAKRIDKYFEF